MLGQICFCHTKLLVVFHLRATIWRNSTLVYANSLYFSWRATLETMIYQSYAVHNTSSCYILLFNTN